MDAYDINMTKPAEDDLRDIARYISSQLNAPTTALKMVRTIREEISKLETMPTAYPLVRDDRLAALGYRLLPIKNYIAFFIVYEKERIVDVDRILYGRRDWAQIL